MSEQNPVNGEVARKMAEIDAMTPEQQKAITDAIWARMEENRVRDYEQAQADADAAFGQAAEAFRRMQELTPAKPEAEPEDDKIPAQAAREAWLDLEDLRRPKFDEKLDIGGVEFGPEELPYMTEGVLIAARLVNHGALTIIGLTPGEGKPTDDSQNFFVAVRLIAGAISEYVHHGMLDD
jgi:hypothetical protein